MMCSTSGSCTSKKKITLLLPDFAVPNANTVAAEGAAILDSEIEALS